MNTKKTNSSAIEYTASNEVLSYF